jgi:hypothetical protein
MRGGLLYIAGQDFDARKEIWTLQAQVEKQKLHRGFASAIRLLVDLALDGYKPSTHPLEQTNFDNVLLFEDAGMRLAFNVPGNGRAPSPDIMLLASGTCTPDRAVRAASRAKFITDAAVRRKHGQSLIWPLTKAL